MTDMKTCPCCGQLRPYPTQPGNWEYRELEWETWTKARIVLSTGTERGVSEKGILLFYPEGATEPQWWPGAQWRKV